MPILTNILQKAGASAQPQKRVKQNSTKDGKGKRPSKSVATSAEKATRGGSGTSLKKEQAHGAYGIIVRPHISEKSVDQSRMGKYVFEVYEGTKSSQVRVAVEKTYGVAVSSVHMVRVPGRKTRMRGRTNTVNRYDKAIVTLKTGHSIEVLPQ